MPSPIAHLSVGYVIWSAFRSRLPDVSGGNSERRLRAFSLTNLQSAIVHRQSLFACLFFAMLPDVDAVAGVLFGNMKRFHNNITHSLVTGLAASALMLAGARVLRFPFAWRWFWIALLGYESHVVMDLFTQGRGVMLFWPFTAERFQSAVLLFYGLQWAASPTSPTHLWTLVNELGFVGLLALMVFLIRRGGRARRTGLQER